MIGRVRLSPSYSFATALDSDINQTAGSGGYLSMWENQCMHGTVCLLRAGQPRCAGAAAKLGQFVGQFSWVTGDPIVLKGLYRVIKIALYNHLRTTAIRKLLEMIGRVRLCPSYSFATALDSDINQTAGSGGYLSMWENRCMHGTVCLLRADQPRRAGAAAKSGQFVGQFSWVTGDPIVLKGLKLRHSNEINIWNLYNPWTRSLIWIRVQWRAFANRQTMNGQTCADQRSMASQKTLRLQYTWLLRI